MSLDNFAKIDPVFMRLPSKFRYFLATDWQHFLQYPLNKNIFLSHKNLTDELFPKLERAVSKVFSFCISLLILFFQSLYEFVREFLRRNLCPNLGGVQF